MAFPNHIALIWRTLLLLCNVTIMAFLLLISWQMLIYADSIAFWQRRWMIRGANMWRPSKGNIIPFMECKVILNGRNGAHPFYPFSFLNYKRILIIHVPLLCGPFTRLINVPMTRSEMLCAISFRIPMICLLETNHIN